MKNKFNFVIYTPKSDLWRSCHFHQKELISIYKKKLKNVIEVKCNQKNNYSNRLLFHFPKNINGATCNFYLISPQLNYSEIAEHFLLMKGFRGSVIIHVYGNAFVEQKKLIKLIHIIQMNKWHLKLITPSLCLKRCLEFMLQRSNGIFNIPFFQRESLPPRLAPKTNSSKCITIGYAGRIEESKNLHLLIQLFRDKKIFKKYRLRIAGTFDYHIYTGTKKKLLLPYVQKILKAYRTLPPEAKKRIEFMGQLNSRDMEKFYQTIDLYINLSTFYGEVYGLSLTEALSHQRQILASAWGGFTEFRLPLSCLVPVRMTKSNNPKINLEEVKSKIINYNPKIKIPSQKRNFEKKKSFILALNSSLNLRPISPQIINKKNWSKIFIQATIKQ